MSKWHFPQFLGDLNSGAVIGYQNYNSSQTDIWVQVHFQALSFQRLSTSPSHTNTGSSISAAHQHIYSIMTTCRATSSDPTDYFLIHLRILICSVMACLLRWVEGGGNTDIKKKKDSWTICSQQALSFPAGGDQSETSISCMPGSRHPNLLAVNPKLGKYT